MSLLDILRVGRETIFLCALWFCEEWPDLDPRVGKGTNPVVFLLISYNPCIQHFQMTIWALPVGLSWVIFPLCIPTAFENPWVLFFRVFTTDHSKVFRKKPEVFFYPSLEFRLLTNLVTTTSIKHSQAFNRGVTDFINIQIFIYYLFVFVIPQKRLSNKFSLCNEYFVCRRRFPWTNVKGRFSKSTNNSWYTVQYKKLKICNVTGLKKQNTTKDPSRSSLSIQIK